MYLLGISVKFRKLASGLRPEVYVFNDRLGVAAPDEKPKDDDEKSEKILKTTKILKQKVTKVKVLKKKKKK